MARSQSFGLETGGSWGSWETEEEKGSRLVETEMCVGAGDFGQVRQNEKVEKEGS